MGVNEDPSASHQITMEQEKNRRKEWESVAREVRARAVGEIRTMTVVSFQLVADEEEEDGDWAVGIWEMGA